MYLLTRFEPAQGRSKFPATCCRYVLLQYRDVAERSQIICLTNSYHILVAKNWPKPGQKNGPKLSIRKCYPHFPAFIRNVINVITRFHLRYLLKLYACCNLRS